MAASGDLAGNSREVRLQVLVCPALPCDLAVLARDVLRIVKEDAAEEPVLDLSEWLGMRAKAPEAQRRVLMLRAPFDGSSSRVLALRVYGPLDSCVANATDLLELPPRLTHGGRFNRLLVDQGKPRALVLDAAALECLNSDGERK